ncbi:MAG: cupin domain-containing protein [Nocardioidaceae bacterium]
MLEGVLKPGASSSRQPWSHPPEECVVVTSGILVAEVDSQRHELRTGDSCYFDSRLPHRYLNDQQIPAVFLISITPPSF